MPLAPEAGFRNHPSFLIDLLTLWRLERIAPVAPAFGAIGKESPWNSVPALPLQISLLLFRLPQ
jgi:hypothetical protein